MSGLLNGKLPYDFKTCDLKCVLYINFVHRYDTKHHCQELTFINLVSFQLLLQNTLPDSVVNSDSFEAFRRSAKDFLNKFLAIYFTVLMLYLLYLLYLLYCTYTLSESFNYYNIYSAMVCVAC